MPPKRVSYSRVEPAPRQTRLSSRRSLPLTHRRDSPPTRQKRQSTLTQIDYIRSSAVIPNSSDEDEEESEYEEMQPKKKVKTSDGKKGKTLSRSQSTLTQKWDWRAMAVARDSEESGDDLAMLDDDEEQKEKTVHQRPKFKGHTQTQSELLLSAHLDSDSESESVARPQKRVAFAPSSEIDRTSTRPTTADSTATTNPKTPQRPRRTVIPSSETPSSLKLSPTPPKQREMYERSPLKERSSNLPSLKRSRSPSIDKKLNERRKSRDQGLDEKENGKSGANLWAATLTITPKKDPAAVRNKLQRTTTIQESDTSDMELEVSPVTSKSEDPAAFFPRNNQTKRRSFQRVTTIQDSEENSSDLIDMDENKAPVSKPNDGQGLAPEKTSNETGTVDDLGEEHPDHDAPKSDPPEIDLSPKRASQSTPPDLDVPQTFDTEHLHSEIVDPQALYGREDTAPRHTEHAVEVVELDDETDDDLEPRINEEDGEDGDEDDGYVDEEIYPQTYDPVSAALDRDAARYGRDTQYESDVDHADDEESVVAESDRDRESGQVVDEVEVVPSSQPGEARIRSSQEHETRRDHERFFRKPAPVGEIDDSGYSSQTCATKSNNAARSIPGTNKGPRPSQVSTVVDDIQSPRSRPNSAHGPTQKSMPAWPETLTSSPFPVPPDFAMKSQRRGETQSSGFIDFSLPPPPPLMLSSSRNEGDGS